MPAAAAAAAVAWVVKAGLQLCMLMAVSMLQGQEAGQNGSRFAPEVAVAAEAVEVAAKALQVGRQACGAV